MNKKWLQLSRNEVQRRKLGRICFEIAKERAIIVNWNVYDLDDQAYLAGHPTKRFNELYDSAYEVAEKIIGKEMEDMWITRLKDY